MRCPQDAANSAIRSHWEGPFGLGLVVLFLLSGHQVWLIGTSLGGLQFGHVVFVMHTVAGLWVSYAGLRRGDKTTRLLCLPVLGFFIGVVALLYFRGKP